PSSTPVLAFQQAFDLEVTLPTEVVGRQFTAYFDLFDNQNGIPSQAFFQDFIIVPEPNTRWLIILGGLGLVVFIRRSRERRYQRDLEDGK
ncbi:MAG TPA: PEP-CTERM sorting domain-containing protein, partial [Verrucomicrobiae bacterium]|nr:PEP-CTERM sorting domain-containing protein [Verrucomicrobiae bacterium]